MTARITGNAGSLRIWRARAVSAEVGHRRIIDICADAEKNSATRDFIEQILTISTETLGKIDINATFQTDNFCPECGTPLINGKCPQPAKHNGGVE